MLCVTLQTNTNMQAGSVLTIHGLHGAIALDGDMAIEGSNSSLFASSNRTSVCAYMYICIHEYFEFEIRRERAKCVVILERSSAPLLLPLSLNINICNVCLGIDDKTLCIMIFEFMTELSAYFECDVYTYVCVCIFSGPWKLG